MWADGMVARALANRGQPRARQLQALADAIGKPTDELFREGGVGTARERRRDTRHGSGCDTPKFLHGLYWQGVRYKDGD